MEQTTMCDGQWASLNSVPESQDSIFTNARRSIQAYRHLEPQCMLISLGGTCWEAGQNMRRYLFGFAASQLLFGACRGYSFLGNGAAGKSWLCHGHPSFVTPSSFTNQVLAQIELWQDHDKYQNQVYRLPRILDEKVARLHLAKLAANLTSMTAEQCDHLGDGAITQYFYNLDAYLYFRDAVVKRGVTVPIVPGIMPITNYTQLQRFSTACGAEIPRWLSTRLQELEVDNEALRDFGADVVATLCSKLLQEEAPGLHFYTLNRAAASNLIFQRLGGAAFA